MTVDELLPIFREQFPEFGPGGANPQDDTTVKLYLNLALQVHAICEMATVYLAAHLLTVLQGAGAGIEDGGAPIDGGGAAREVSAETAKSISTTFKSMVADGDGDSFYTSTAYGRMYIVLRDSCPGRRFSVRVA